MLKSIKRKYGVCVQCKANAANALSIIADETADIPGVEQLTIIVIRFFRPTVKSIKNIREKCLVFLPLDQLINR